MENRSPFAPRRAVVSFACTLALVSTSWATSRYVNANLASGANDGTSWANAFRTSDGVRAALAVALPGDTLWVAQGTYLPTTTGSRSVAFELKIGVGLYGGFAGNETLFSQRDPALHVTTLSGDLAGDDGANNFADNSLHVIRGTSLANMATLEGFVITGGNANGATSADTRGAGLLLTASSNPAIRNCRFEGNRCSPVSAGSVVYADASSPRFSDVRFEDNVCPALRLLDTGTLDLVKCAFVGHTGSSIHVGSGSAIIATNCLIANSSASGVVCATGSSGVALLHSTVANNGSFALTGPVGIGLLAQNSVIYFNNGGGAQTSGTFFADHSCIQGGAAGTGNLAANPEFVDAAARDYRLSAGSPCIDAGTNAPLSALTATDLAGSARPVDDPFTADTGTGTAPICDAGCFEYSPPEFGSFCFGDGTFVDHTTACPCGNVGSAGNGCAHSFAASGANLSATGDAATDDVQLHSQFEPATSFTLFMQHDAVDERVFHDGTLCAGGTLVRLRGRAAVGGEAFFPNTLFANDATLTLSQRGGVFPGQGVRRYYAAWYRNASTTFCPPATANVTNGWQIAW